ncbi:MAG TPA: hypothetical protein ENJ33_02010 [Thiothrix sp.]|nr:hypothetical protein [Thiothrix sp.]
MKKLHTPLLAIALSALLVSVSYGNANDDQVPSNDIIDSTVTNSPFADSFNTVEDESANADTSGDSAYIQQAVTNSDLSLDGNILTKIGLNEATPGFQMQISVPLKN